MRNLLRAEWLKMTRNFKPFSFLVLVYPVGTATVIGMFLLGLLSGRVREALAGSPVAWTDQLLLPWVALNSFPQNIFLRLPFLAFVALLFAGEYQWQTWKNVVPRSRRAALVLAKFGALAGLLLLVGLLTSAIWGGGRVGVALLAGARYAPAGEAALLRTFARAYLLEVGIALVGILILAGYAALVALRARSILAGIFLSLGLAIVEPVSLILFLMLGQLLERPGLVHLFRLTPTYNLENVRAWVLHGEPAQIIPTVFLNPESPTIAEPLIFSLALLLFWGGGLLALSILTFRRQDIVA